MKIPISKIIPDENQPRERFTGIKELAKSLKEVGLLEPLWVIRSGSTYLLIDGERRTLAAKELGWRKIDIDDRVLKWSYKDAYMKSLSKHHVRNQHSKREHAKGVLRSIDLLLEDYPTAKTFKHGAKSVLFGMHNIDFKLPVSEEKIKLINKFRNNVEEICAKFGYSYKYFIDTYLPLTELKEDLEKEFAHLSEETLALLNKIKDKNWRKKAVEKCKKETLNMAEIKNLTAILNYAPDNFKEDALREDARPSAIWEYWKAYQKAKKKKEKEKTKKYKKKSKKAAKKGTSKKEAKKEIEEEEIDTSLADKKTDTEKTNEELESEKWEEYTSTLEDGYSKISIMLNPRESIDIISKLTTNQKERLSETMEININKFQIPFLQELKLKLSLEEEAK